MLCIGGVLLPAGSPAGLVNPEGCIAFSAPIGYTSLQFRISTMSTDKPLKRRALMSGESAKTEGTLRTLRIWDTDVSLKADRLCPAEKDFVFRISSAESLDVTPGEATVFLNTTDERLSADLSLQGIVLDDRSTRITRDAMFLRSQLPADGLLVMLDTTTIFDAILCLYGPVTPIQLLDLSVLAFAAVCFDQIVV
jgi:hypothetical protein